MRHVVLYSTVHAFDELATLPLEHIVVVGLAEDDNAAIDMIAAHAEANVADIAQDFGGHPYGYKPGDRPWYLRGGGPKGLDITAGYGGTYDRRTYYRAVPIA